MPKVVTALISRDAANRTELSREEGGRLGMKGTNGKAAACLIWWTSGGEAAGLNWSGDVRSCETGRLTSARCRLFPSVTPLDFVYRKQLPTIRLLHKVTAGMLLLSSKARDSHACSSALARSRRHTCVNPRSGSMLTCPFANRARTSAGSSGGRS